jgi:hypothetical protein
MAEERKEDRKKNRGFFIHGLNACFSNTAILGGMIIGPHSRPRVVPNGRI